ncbi:PREDICTED: gamma-secretase subunit Aph-1-like [Priapulus caudatus]|uniref:Gamma-secretase subunit Aph-1-like n=1 Tax=Priapulus caudatus TaxID=37621 RepID=A0ABM1ES28_PRICU|nr:PREDICTED: gamma-secretase subunit Aph-1-like [Priapulus caudatus]XP_014674999.1 PREDICTED: gamma-secretase subunit Aph-1-like [Priapulus caudatus]
MTLMEFFGCTFIGFGPPLALFIFTISGDPLRIIILIAGAFFWLMSLLLSSILWYAVVPLREELAFGLVFSVIFQELFRFGYYYILRKAESGLKKVSDFETGAGVIHDVITKHSIAYVAGLGFGLMSGAFSLVNVLADSSGPGTVGIQGQSDLFFITSAFMTLCFVFLHTFWGVIFFHSLDTKNYIGVGVVIGSHMLISCLSLLNVRELYAASLVPAYVVMLLMGGWAYVTAGGSLNNVKACFTPRSQAFHVY